MAKYSTMYSEKVIQRVFPVNSLRNLISVTMGRGNE